MGWEAYWAGLVQDARRAGREPTAGEREMEFRAWLGRRGVPMNEIVRVAS